MSTVHVRDMWNTKIDCRFPNGKVNCDMQDKYMTMCDVQLKAWGFGTYVFFYVVEMMETGSYYLHGFKESEEDKFLELNCKEINIGLNKDQIIEYIQGHVVVKDAASVGMKLAREHLNADLTFSGIWEDVTPYTALHMLTDILNKNYESPETK